MEGKQKPSFVCLFCSQGYFKSLRMEVYRDNIGITLICPGLVYSNLMKNAPRENLQVYRQSTSEHFILYTIAWELNR